MRPVTPDSSKDPRVAIIGAGFGGVAAAAHLTMNGFTNFRVFERCPQAGGVWYQNTYPGAEVDTPSAWYSYKFKRFDWPQPHSGQAVLAAYINETIDNFGMRERFEFNIEVRRVIWDDTLQTYSVHLFDHRVEQFNIVISAIGLFNSPNYPCWKGLDKFNGPVFHSARWEHEHDLRGKRVAIVGAGSTGAQIVTELAPRVGHLLVIQRDPTWVLQKKNRFYSDEERRKRQKPWFYKWERLRFAYAEQKRFISGKLFLEGSSKNITEQRTAAKYIEIALGDYPELKEAVTPTHPFFGKRNIKADGYYETLRRDNVTFVRGQVTEVFENGLIDADRNSYEVDVIVMATGFEVPDFLKHIEVIGRRGKSLHEFWDGVGGAEAFLGLTVPGFPNFYMLYGPNTNMGQIVFNLETQSRYVVRDLKRMRRSGISAIEVKERVHRRYNDWLQSALSRTIWVNTSNYLKSAAGKLVVPFPRASIIYWALTRMLRRVSHQVVTAEPASQTSPPHPVSASQGNLT